MDQETREFLERRFNTIDEKFTRIDQRFDAIDQKLAHVDQRFDGTDQRLAHIEQRFDGAIADIDQKFEESKRYFGVVAEGLRSEIRQVAEGVANVDEKLDREITALREENEQSHREILSAIKFSYAELDRRIRTLEEDFLMLKDRLDRLEAR